MNLELTLLRRRGPRLFDALPTRPWSPFASLPSRLQRRGQQRLRQEGRGQRQQPGQGPEGEAEKRGRETEALAAAEARLR